MAAIAVFAARTGASVSGSVYDRATAPLCAGGTFAEHDGAFSIYATLTCSDGTGTFTWTLIQPVGPPPVSVGRQQCLQGRAQGESCWSIGGGTGTYVKLIGGGAVQSLDQQPDGNYIRVNTGAVDFDTAPPSFTMERLSASRIAGNPHTYLVNVLFAAQDESSVHYQIALKAGTKRLAGDGTIAG